MTPMVVALGANLRNRLVTLRRAAAELANRERIVLISSVWETDPVDSPPGSPPYLNAVVAGFTSKTSRELLWQLHRIERAHGRRRTTRNAPRSLDLDLIFYGAVLSSEAALMLPHPRFAQREFVMAPLRELGLPWVDPRTGASLERIRVDQKVRRIGPLFAAAGESAAQRHVAPGWNLLNPSK